MGYINKLMSCYNKYLKLFFFSISVETVLLRVYWTRVCRFLVLLCLTLQSFLTLAGLMERVIDIVKHFNAILAVNYSCIQYFISVITVSVLCLCFCAFVLYFMLLWAMSLTQINVCMYVCYDLNSN